MYLPNSSTMSRIWHNVIFYFKQSKADLNSEFFFFYKGFITKDKKNQSTLQFTHSWEKKNRWIHSFPKDNRAKCNVNSLIQDFNLGC